MNIFSSDVDRHRLDAEPDTDPNFHVDADTHADPTISFIRVGK
jgi:hypothetical protein